MEADNEEESYTLTSFEPLPPEDEKSGLRKFIEGFKSPFVPVKGTLHESKPNPEGDSRVTYLKSDIRRSKQLPKQSIVSLGLISSDKRSLEQLEHGRVVSNLRSRTPSSVLGRLSQLVLLEKSYPQVNKNMLISITL